MLKNYMESTDQSTVKNYPGPWLKHRESRSISDDVVWLFSDGSSTGWFGAVIIHPGKSIRRLSKYEESPNRNINPEFNGAILGLEALEPGTKVNIVHDLLGLGAWVIGEWRMTKPAVKAKTDQIRKIIKEKNLDVHFIHHAGHQNKKRGERPICNSEFTKYNCEADKLCGSAEVRDTVEALC